MSMKIKNILIMVCFAIVIGISCCGTVASAAASTVFTDVNSDAWYYQYVQPLSQQKIINGYEDGSFRPKNNVTYGEALKLILGACDYPIESLSTPEEVKAYWGSDVIKTAERIGIIQPGTVDGNQLATRADIGEFIVRAKNWQKASHIDGVFGDTDDHSAEILYQKGIITGIAGSKTYNYNPDANITRAEMSAVIYRVYDYNPLELQPIIKDAEAFLVENPSTEEDFLKITAYMGKNNLYSVKIAYTDSPSKYSYEDRVNLCQMALNAQNAAHFTYPEFFSYVGGANAEAIVENGVLYIIITQWSVQETPESNPSYTTEQLKTMRAEAFSIAEDNVKKLIESELITAEMSDTEKAKAVYTWVSANCSYDKEFGDASYTGYGAAKNQLAVCQGYTALYNTMCKYLGIYCEGQAGVANNGTSEESHLWTLASLDGKNVYIDVTFGDTSSQEENLCDYKYFAVPVDELWSSHKI